MLHLAAPTAPQWAPWALSQLDEILLDHAHCEKKAASTAVNLIFRYQDKRPLMVPLARLAREELAHFELVLEHVDRRGGVFERQHPSGYAPELMKVVRRKEPLRLIDTLLCCAMIEARSCERMQLLAEALEADGRDPELTGLYRGLLASEARHHSTYLDVLRALELLEEEPLRERLGEVAAFEAEVIAALPGEARLHSGYRSPAQSTNA